MVCTYSTAHPASIGTTSAQLIRPDFPGMSQEAFHKFGPRIKFCVKSKIFVYLTKLRTFLAANIILGNQWLHTSTRLVLLRTSVAGFPALKPNCFGGKSPAARVRFRVHVYRVVGMQIADLAFIDQCESSFL